jgi:PAS domain-containing protein
VYKDEGNARVYAASGALKAVVPFGGRRQRVPANDGFGDPQDDLFALSYDGRYLAASFSDGSAHAFDTREAGVSYEAMAPSGYTRFEGGFSGGLLAFSATGGGRAEFRVADMRTGTVPYRLEDAGNNGGYFGAAAGGGGILVSSGDRVVRLDAGTWEQHEAAYPAAGVLAFATDGRHVAVSTDDGRFLFYDQNAARLSSYTSAAACDLLRVAGGRAVVGGRDSRTVRILRYEAHDEEQVFAYDPSYAHDEARVRADGRRAMLFSYKGFRLYGADEGLLREAEIPDAALVTDQQYSMESGNLAVLYEDAFRLYSGETGGLLVEETGLSSVFYAPYGVSVLRAGGALDLIGLDSARVERSARAQGGFAAFCGMVVDEAFLGGRELIGAAGLADEDGAGGAGDEAGGAGDEAGGGGAGSGARVVFAVAGGAAGAVYDGEGRELFAFDVPGGGQAGCEAYFAGGLCVIEPKLGTPVAYSLKTGARLADLAQDAYIAYLTPLGGRVVAEYVTANAATRERYGVLLSEGRCEALAVLPGLAGVLGDGLLFDYGRGALRASRLYSEGDLVQIARGLAAP